jgi:uncharacterized membrane protein
LCEEHVECWLSRVCHSAKKGALVFTLRVGVHLVHVKVGFLHFTFCLWNVQSYCCLALPSLHQIGDKSFASEIC